MTAVDAVDLALTSINIKQFRGVPKDLNLDCGQITVFGGSNGLGKTTVFDAIDWALFGDAWRLGQDGDRALFNLWAPGRPQVDLFFGSTRLTRDRNAAVFQDVRYSPADHLVRDSSVFARPSDIPDVVRRCIYLAQEEMRDLIKGPQDRRSSLIAALSGIPFVERFERNVDNTLRDIAIRVRRDSEVLAAARTRRTELEERQRAFLLQGQALVTHRARAAEHFGTELPSTTAGAVAVMHSHVSSAEEEIRALRARGDAATRLAERLPLLRDLRARAESERLRLTAELESVGKAEAAILTELDSLSKGHAKVLDDRQKLEQVETTLIGRQRETASLRALVEQRRLREAEVERLLADLSVLKTAIAEVEGIRASAHRQLVESRQSLAAATATAGTYARALATRKERETVQLRRTHLEVALQDVIARAATARAEALAAQQETLQTAERLRVQRQLGDATARLMAALHDVREALHAGAAHGDPERCPLCGHGHASEEDLRDNVGRTATLPADDIEGNESIAEATRVAEAAAERAANAERQVELIGAESRALTVEIAACDASLASLDSPPVEASADRLAQLTGEIEIGRARVDELERTLADCAERETSSRGRTKQLEERVERTRALLASDARVAVSPISDTDEDTLRAQLSEARSRLERVLAEVAAKQRSLSEARSRAEEFAQRRATLESEIRRTGADLAGVQNDEARALSEAKTLLSNTGGEPVQALHDVVGECSKKIRIRSSWLGAAREILDAIQKAAGVDELPTIESELQNIVHEIESCETDIGRLEMALKSLETIRAHVRTDIENEGQVARRRFQQAIDSILAGLSPYRHLNRIVVDEGGSLGLNDARLDRVVEPHLYSSTGQLNCAALAIFLGLAVTATLDRVGFIMLDEPVQNLDDVNILNFIDVVRRVAKSKQVLMSTADRNLFLLLKKKLSVWARAEGQRVVFHDFREFSRDEGPIVTAEVAGDLKAA
ncbi:MAG TPA: AAA family ATPase [Polyangia bacterium]|jgi:DNA repair exonuclease SbcCD ATPase subunit|nr:AAA family ATPase [Polyangia bacterium]